MKTRTKYIAAGASGVVAIGLGYLAWRHFHSPAAGANSTVAARGSLNTNDSVAISAPSTGTSSDATAGTAVTPSSTGGSSTGLGAGVAALPVGSAFQCYTGMIEGFPAQYVGEATTLAQQIASEGMGVIARFVDGQNHYLAKGCVVSAVLGSVPYSPQYGFVSRLAAVGVGNPQIWAAANGMTNITVVAQYASSGGPS